MDMYRQGKVYKTHEKHYSQWPIHMFARIYVKEAKPKRYLA